MSFFEKVFHWLEWAIPGFFGAVFVYLVVPSQRHALNSKKDVILFLISGGVISHFLTPLATWYFKPEPASIGGIGFLLGAFGGAIFTAIMKGIDASDLWALVKSRFGGGSQ